jgi:lipoprotein-anchoring transpeptidase ErfK/SrfK
MARSPKVSGQFVFRAAAAGAVLISVSSFAAHERTERTASPPVNGEGKRMVVSAMQLSQLQLPGLPRGQRGSVLNISAPMQYGQFVWDDSGVPVGPVSIRVDLKAQTISVFRSGHEIGTAVILYGADEKPTPTGDFHILQKLEDHRSSLYGAAMPYTLRLTGDGIAIHGSDVRRGAATHGCIGVPTAFAKALFHEAKSGDRVIVV